MTTACKDAMCGANAAERWGHRVVAAINCFRPFGAPEWLSEAAASASSASNACCLTGVGAAASRTARVAAVKTGMGRSSG